MRDLLQHRSIGNAVSMLFEEVLRLVDRGSQIGDVAASSRLPSGTWRQKPDPAGARNWLRKVELKVCDALKQSLRGNSCVNLANSVQGDRLQRNDLKGWSAPHTHRRPTCLQSHGGPIVECQDSF